MRQERKKRLAAALGGLLIMGCMAGCQTPGADQEWWDEQSEYAEVDLSITETPTEDPAEQLAPFLGKWSLTGFVAEFELVDHDTVRYNDLSSGKFATCTYEVNPMQKKLVLEQIDAEADGASLKTGGMVCILEDDDHMKTTTLDGTGAKKLVRVTEGGEEDQAADE